MKFKYISLLVVFTLVFSLFLRWVEDGIGRRIRAHSTLAFLRFVDFAKAGASR